MKYIHYICIWPCVSAAVVIQFTFIFLFLEEIVLAFPFVQQTFSRKFAECFLNLILL